MGAVIILVIFSIFVLLGKGFIRFFFGSDRNNNDGVFGFFVELFEELFRGKRFARTLAKLCAFGSVIVLIAILMSILI